MNAQGCISAYNNRVCLTGLTELEALPASQLLVQDASQNGGQQQDRSADGWVVGGDQRVRHECYTTSGCRCVTYMGKNTHCYTVHMCIKQMSQQIQEIKQSTFVLL